MRRPLQVGVCGLLAAASSWSQVPESAPGEPPPRRLTTIERLSEERLAAAHADIQRLRAPVQPPPPLSGLNDYRGVFHAHAGDSMRALVAWMLDPAESKALARAAELYPEEVFGAQFDYPAFYLEKWDRETARRRVVGVNANDCHHNQVFVVIKVDDESVRVGTIIDDPDEMRILTAADAPGIPELVRGHAAGAATELKAHFPLPATIRLIRNGEEVAVTEARTLTHRLDQPGAYRVESWLEVDGEWRTWIYSNPVYVK